MLALRLCQGLFGGLGALASGIAGGVANALGGSSAAGASRMAQQQAQRMSRKEQKRREKEVGVNVTACRVLSATMAVPQSVCHCTSLALLLCG